jgi:hypothetical protein
MRDVGEIVVLLVGYLLMAAIGFGIVIAALSTSASCCERSTFAKLAASFATSLRLGVPSLRHLTNHCLAAR